MKRKYTKAAATASIVLAILAASPVCRAGDYTIAYQLLDKIDGTAAYKLNVAIPQTLLEYYIEKSHRLTSEKDFAKFVTPYALKPIADNLRELYAKDEDFVNGALMIVHQIPYQETTPVKYPLETIADNKGDCDLFALTAASIIKAGELNVVLLHYKEEKHMNIGVHLAEAPKKARENIYSVTHNNITYYIAECTGGNWTYGWRIGECPSNLKEAEAQVITLEDSEKMSPGQISASFIPLEPSAIALEISPPVTFQENTITFRGQLTPAKPDENVTIYLGASGSPWTILGTAITQQDGRFEYVWKAEAAGIYAVRASWIGDDSYRGAVSPTKNALIISYALGAVIAAVVAVAVITPLAVFALRRSKQEMREPETEETPTLS
ncbi:MAG: Ig-like domain-containing protein [Candidatus Bathyarchaeota archaeon]|nr:Ig-like domain-containing protein [Candidatus Bathyarchaeota archaeon]